MRGAGSDAPGPHLMKRHPLPALFVLGAAIVAVLRADVSPPNVVLFLIDDMGWTDLACCGSATYETPHLDRLAAEGMKFTQAYSACTVCSPSRAAILTGKYPARLHVTDWIPGHIRPFTRLRVPDWTKQLPLEETTLAEALQQRGYVTGLFGKWHLGDEPFYPEHQGFEVNIGGCEYGLPRNYYPPYGQPAVGLPGLKDERPGEFLVDRLTREAIGFIERNRDRPFFVYFPNYAVHEPIAGKPAVIEKYKRKIRAGMTHDNATYAALVESVDDSVGAVLATLDELHLTDRTLIVFTSDNGGLTQRFAGGRMHLGPTRNDPLRAGKGSAYEGGVRVPQIIKWPGHTRAGAVCDTPVIGADVFPTVLDIVDGPKADRGVDGESLVPLLEGAGGLQRDAIFWHYPHYHPGGATPYGAVRQGDWKLVEFYEDDRVELYNLRDDIGEQHDRAGTEPAKAAELRLRLAAWRTRVGAQMPQPNPDYDPARERVDLYRGPFNPKR